MAMSSQDMDPDVARTLFREGATLIFLDVPPKTEFGIDHNTWNVGTEFKGVKMIPPGIHFVYYSAVSSDNQTAPRTGFFHSFKKGEIVVKKWDNYLEDIKDEVISDEEIERFKVNLKDLDKHLGAYPYDSWKKWISQTHYITDEVLDRIEPLNKKISSVSHLVTDESPESSTRTSKRPRLDDLLPKMCHKPGTEIRFSKFPEKKYPDGSSAAEITRHSLDSTYTLDQMLESYAGTEDILGELQMAFICFILGQVFDAFEEWKHLIALLCSCDVALTKYPDLYSKFIFVLHHQLQEIPQDFFVDIVSRENFLVNTLHSFFSNLNGNQQVAKEVVEKGRRFKKYLTKTFKWDFDREDDDEAPVVVETEEM
uniref:Protein AAR2 homolog n=1 Tax=Strigamia maritima TaxID=126957 RepID=T1IJM4_STRMM